MQPKPPVQPCAPESPVAHAVSECPFFQLHLVGQMHFCLKKAILVSGVITFNNWISLKQWHSHSWPSWTWNTVPVQSASERSAALEKPHNTVSGQMWQPRVCLSNQGELCMMPGWNQKADDPPECRIQPSVPGLSGPALKQSSSNYCPQGKSVICRYPSPVWTALTILLPSCCSSHLFSTQGLSGQLWLLRHPVAKLLGLISNRHKSAPVLRMSAKSCSSVVEQ